MEVEYTKGTTCCVTHHLVEEVSWTNPKLFRDKGGVKLYETLYHLGFNINWRMNNKNVSTHKNVLIRSNENYEECYYTKIHKGWVRNAVDYVDGTEVVYDRYKFHHMLDQYNKYEVLQPDNLSDYVKDDELLKVEDFGGKAKLAECILLEDI